MKSKTGAMTLVFLLAVSPAAWAETGDERFLGGSYDGWDRYVMAEYARLGGALVSLSSETDQTFVWTATAALLATMTIEAEEPQGAITNGGTMRLTVPAAWACRFDTSVGVTYGGNAVGKVGAAGYADGGRTLEIPVTADFTAGNTLTISGLKLLDLSLCSIGIQRLELDFTGNGTRDVYDANTLTLTVTWPGGSYDGWDRYVMAEYGSLRRKGRTVIKCVNLMETQGADSACGLSEPGLADVLGRLCAWQGY